MDVDGAQLAKDAVQIMLIGVGTSMVYASFPQAMIQPPVTTGYLMGLFLSQPRLRADVNMIMGDVFQS